MRTSVEGTSGRVPHSWIPKALIAVLPSCAILSCLIASIMRGGPDGAEEDDLIRRIGEKGPWNENSATNLDQITPTNNCPLTSSAAVAALAHRGPDTIQKVIEASEHPSALVRVSAVSALQFQPGPKVEAALIGRLQADWSSTVRAAAAYALMADVDRPGATEALLNQLPGESSAEVQKAIVLALGRRKDARASLALFELLGNPERSRVWLVAAEGLANAPQDLVSAMERRLKELREAGGHDDAAKALELAIKGVKGELTLQDIEDSPHLGCTEGHEHERSDR